MHGKQYKLNILFMVVVKTMGPMWIYIETEATTVLSVCLIIICHYGFLITIIIWYLVSQLICSSLLKMCEQSLHIMICIDTDE